MQPVRCNAGAHALITPKNNSKSDPILSVPAPPADDGHRHGHDRNGNPAGCSRELRVPACSMLQGTRQAGRRAMHAMIMHPCAAFKGGMDVGGLAACVVHMHAWPGPVNGPARTHAAPVHCSAHWSACRAARTSSLATAATTQLLPLFARPASPPAVRPGHARAPAGRPAHQRAAARGRAAGEPPGRTHLALPACL